MLLNWAKLKGFVAVLTDYFDSFGCKYRSTKTGITYNNEMGDFSTPGQLNPDEIEPSKSNFIKPGKRPQSSMSPVIFTDRNGRVRMVAGASGGPLITTAVSLVSYICSREGGGGVLPYMGYIGSCRGIGFGF